jgi:hypothetical protein
MESAHIIRLFNNFVLTSNKSHRISDKRANRLVILAPHVQVLSRTLNYRLDDQLFESRRGLVIFLFTTSSRPALASDTVGTGDYLPGGEAAGA